MYRGRQPDKPGTFRIRTGKDGNVKLSGVRSDGKRVRIGGLTQSEAEEMSRRLFPVRVGFQTPVAGDDHQADDWSQTDSFGLPIKVSDAAAESVAKTLKLPTVGPPKEEPPKPDPEDEAKRARRAKNAKSLMDLGGIGIAAGSVMVGRKLCDATNKEAVKPDPKQTNDLRDSAKEALIEMFGDAEISPWKMTILLFIGIPLSMLLQSPKRKELPKKDGTTLSGGESTTTGLKAVP